MCSIRDHATARRARKRNPVPCSASPFLPRSRCAWLHPRNWAARIRGALCNLSVRDHWIAQQAARACALSLNTVTTRSFTHIGALQASKLQYACMQSARRVFANQANECLKLYAAVKAAKVSYGFGKAAQLFSFLPGLLRAYAQ
jgi:hypothetical protein